jgi:hypothetical protein
MKNLLACYANCRYNTRCDELRAEVEGKLEQATGDINAYLTERGGGPITIQLMKRGLKFADPSKIRPPSPESKRTGKPRLSKAISNSSDNSSGKRRAEKISPVAASKRNTKAEVTSSHVGRRKAALKSRLKESSKMTRKAKSITNASEARKESSPSPAATERESILNQAANGKAAASRKKRARGSGASASNHKGKTYIVLEGNSATLLDEQGLMMRVLNGSSPGARYFEATEVEARVQIIAKR